jgi:hypothetical protein
MTDVMITNPSAFHPLRVYQQDRARNVAVPAPAPEVPKIPTRDELVERGSLLVDKTIRVMVRSDAGMVPATRTIKVPTWQQAGDTSLNEYVTKEIEHATDVARKAAGAAPPSGQRFVDSWGAPSPFGSIPPGGKSKLPLDEHRRLVIECDENVTLQIANQSARTIGLRTRAKNGATTTAGFVGPIRAVPGAGLYARGGDISVGLVTASKDAAAVVEEMPT